MGIRSAIAALTVAGAFAQSTAQISPERCRSLEKKGNRSQAQSCFQQLTASSRAAIRAEGYWGLRNHRQASEEFRRAIEQAPKDADLKVRWGRLFIEPFNKNKKDGAELFSEALEINKKHPGALLGMALVASDGFESKAGVLAREALDADPKLVEAQELLARLALEDSNPTKAVEEADKALTLSAEALDALAVKAAVEILDDRSGEEWLKKIFAVNPSYGEAHAQIAHHLVLNRRYDEGIAHYRKAIELDPQNWHARSRLGISLMQMGQEEEARKHLEAAFDNGFREFATTNSLKLIDSHKNLVTFKTPTTILKLDKKEAEMLRIYFEEELQKAIATYEAKYKMKLPRAVQLEVYPNHDDFAVRTMGIPGLSILGVTFGDVVAMDSPSGRKPGTFHWASTLWHELSHVFVLIATKHRVPRWFTEGVAVHEETAIHKDWGDRLTPEILMAVKDKKLLPIAELDRGFIRPSYPSQVIVSYFQGGRICDYIVEKWGWAKILEMMHAFAARKPTAQVVQDQLGLKPEEFDKQFLAWLDPTVQPVVKNFDEWRKRIRKLAELSKAGNHADVLKEGPEVVEMYPEYVEAANAYEMIAASAEATGDKKSATGALEKFARIGGRSPEALKKLASLQQEAGNPKAAAVTLEKINYIYPINDEDLHKRLGELYLGQKNLNGAIREFRAVVSSKPVDPADAHYNLARAYWAARKTDPAEDHIIQALEAAPGYRPAQKMLLEITASKKEKR